MSEREQYNAKVEAFRRAGKSRFDVPVPPSMWPQESPADESMLGNSPDDELIRRMILADRRAGRPIRPLAEYGYAAADGLFYD